MGNDFGNDIEITRIFYGRFITRVFLLWSLCGSLITCLAASSYVSKLRNSFVSIGSESSLSVIVILFKTLGFTGGVAFNGALSSFAPCCGGFDCSGARLGVGVLLILLLLFFTIGVGVHGPGLRGIAVVLDEPHPIITHYYFNVNLNTNIHWHACML